MNTFVSALGVIVVVLVLALTVLRRHRGFLGAASWSLLPVVGSTLAEGSGLLTLNASLMCMVALTSRRQVSNKRGAGVLVVSACFLFIVMGNYWVRPPEAGESVFTLVASVSAAIFLGMLGRNVAWESGFAVGLVLGGVVMAAAELARVASGGLVHAAVVSFDLNPIALAQYCSIATLVCLYQVVRGRWRMRAMPVALVLIAGVLATGSRGPLLGLAVAIFYLLVLTPLPGPRTSRRILRIVGLAYFVGLSWVLLLQSRVDITELLRLDDSDGNGATRSSAWQGAWVTIQDHFLLGAGPGRYFRSEYGATVGLPDYPHNIWLESWAEYGLLALALLVSVVVMVWRVADPRIQPLVVFATVAYSFSGSIGLSLSFWVPLALAVSTRSTPRELERQSVSPGARPLAVRNRSELHDSRD